MVELPTGGPVAARQSSRQLRRVHRINGIICWHTYAAVLIAREASADALAVIWVAIPGNTMQVERRGRYGCSNTIYPTSHELPTALILAGLA